MDYSGGYIDPSVPGNQVASVPPGWIDIPGCYLGPPEYFSGTCAGGTSASGSAVQPFVGPEAFRAHGPMERLPDLPILTPDNVTAPLPDITLATMPVQMFPSDQQCSIWCDLNGWIAANPVLAVGILAGLAVLGWKR